MKSTKEIIKQMEREFKKQYVCDKYLCDYIDGEMITGERLLGFIHSFIRTLLESFGEEVIKTFMEDLNYYNSDKPPCTEDDPCGCHFGEVFHADGMCLCDTEKRQRLKVKEIISQISK